jgi:predicted peptidase
MLRAAMLATFGLGVLGMPPQSQPPSPFVPRTFARAGHTMPYRVFVPDAKARTQPLPLVVWLHGAGGLGLDNGRQISAGGNEFGSGLWVKPEIQARFPAFVVAPQSPADQLWGNSAIAKPTTYGQLVLDLIEALAQEYSIDRDRVYLLGQSRGGIGVWDLIAKRPDVFAAAVPICATGDPKRIAAARAVKVWVFHGAKDSMPVANARDMVAALTAAGGVVKYTEYPDLGHEIWERAFAEPDLPAWLFAQHRRGSDCGDACAAVSNP